MRLKGFIFLLLTIACVSQLSQASPAASQHAVATAHPLATEAAMEILNDGGNAFDAAVTATAVLAVVEPYSSGLGGGGFWLLHTSGGQDVMLDGRETSPMASTANMYLNNKDEVVPGLSINGPLSAGIPGVPAAMGYLVKNHTNFGLKKLLKPAIKVAREGFKIDPLYRVLAKFRLKTLAASPEASKILLQNDEVPADGFVLKQLGLAKTLQMLADKGSESFYRGSFAQKMVNEVQRAGGIWALSDLENYQVKLREPVEVEVGDLKLVSAAPPSSGGIALATMLQILAEYELQKLSRTAQVHLITEAMRRAYRDRAAYLGDPDYTSVPVERLTSRHYAQGLSASIHPDKATKSDNLPGIGFKPGGQDTTHFSILDKYGNYVSATLSINYPFGSGFVVPGTGILLNDEMDDFVSKPGSPNAYGLVGNKANAIEPGKRMLSSMSPTFVYQGDRLAILGTPGGSRIITMVLHSILEFLQGGSAESMVLKKRFHHQYLPDQIYFEEGVFTGDQMKSLQAKGHVLKKSSRAFGNMQVIVWDQKKNRIEAASDPRGGGFSLVQR